MDDVPSIRKWRVRSANGADLPFLRTMLYAAAFWRPNQTYPLPFEEAMLPPEISRYVVGWGRPSDTAVVAVDMDSHQIGAAWFRLFDRATPGYGFVDDSIPEVTIAVIPDWRGKGIGDALLHTLLDAASTLGFTAVSLSVSEDNPAVRLYRRNGFNRLQQAAESWTMLAQLGQ